MRERFFFDRVKELVSAYSFTKPFSLFLNSYFRSHPQMGARDRRQTRDFCYSFYRLGNALSEQEFFVRLSVAAFLCLETNPLSDFLLGEFTPALISRQELSWEEKGEELRSLFPQFDVTEIFPGLTSLSQSINRNEFLKSFFIQPLLWIRIREKFRKEVVEDLEKNEIVIHEKKSEFCFGLKAGQKIDDLRTYKKGYFEIQDRSSQLMQDYYRPSKKSKWCDACAASGGKSLMLLETEPDLELLAIDLRQNILFNFKERMEKCGWKNFTTIAFDLSEKKLTGKFDGIIADVPCSGSGTWSRSPEHLTLRFDHQKLDHFVKLQRRIVANLVDCLPSGAPLIYSTCSVYREENEENVSFFTQNLPLKAEETSLLHGYLERADTMFVSRMIKV